MKHIDTTHYMLEEQEAALVDKLLEFLDRYGAKKETYNHPNTLIAGVTTIQELEVESEPECSMYYIRVVTTSGDELTITQTTDYGESAEICSGFFEKLSSDRWDFYERKHEPDEVIRIINKTVNLLCD